MEKVFSSKRPRYDAAFRAEALRLASESRSTLAAARALNSNAKLLYQWQKAAQQPLPADPTEAAEVRALRLANKRLAQELEILKKAIAIFSATPDPVSQLQFIDQQRLHYPVQLPCRVLHVGPSRYYAWCQRAETTAAPAWETAMVDVFDDHHRRYGTRRLPVELRELGHRVGRQALRTALRRHGRKAWQPKAFTPRTTDSTHGQRCAPNLLLDQGTPLGQARRRPIGCGSAILPTCRWPPASGSIAAPSRMCAPSRSWAGRCAPTCLKPWSPRPYSEHYSPNGLPPA